MVEEAEGLSSIRIDYEPFEFAKAVSAAPVDSGVVVEATYGWYWEADLLRLGRLADLECGGAQAAVLLDGDPLPLQALLAGVQPISVRDTG
jgi:hypothetical protein